MSEQDLYTCSQTLLLAKTTGMMNKLPIKYYTFVKTIIPKVTCSHDGHLLHCHHDALMQL